MGLLSYDAGPNYLLLRGPITDRGMNQLEGLCGLFALNLDAGRTRHHRGGAGAAGRVAKPWLARRSTRPTMPCHISLACPGSASSAARTPLRVTTDLSR